MLCITFKVISAEWNYHRVRFRSFKKIVLTEIETEILFCYVLYVSLEFCFFFAFAFFSASFTFLFVFGFVFVNHIVNKGRKQHKTQLQEFTRVFYIL